MNTLEYCLVALSTAVERDEIGKAELIRRLGQLHDVASIITEPYPNKDLKRLHESFHHRFDPIIQRR